MGSQPYSSYNSSVQDRALEIVIVMIKQPTYHIRES